MKAYILKRYNKEAKLELADVAKPLVKENEVLIEIFAAGLNLLDSKLKKGEFKLLLPYKLPLILGHDLAGVIKEIGKNVRDFKVGDEVYARASDYHIGTFAEYISIDEQDVALKPKNLSMEEAASVPLVGLTAWQALVEKAKLKKGQKVFIQAGSGGVGTIAIQLAKYLGATVATTASAHNFELVKRLGADVMIDYRKDDFETVLKYYDVVLNSQDDKTLFKSLNILKPNTKLISISGPPDVDFAREIGLPWLMRIIIYFLSRKVSRRATKLGIDYSFLFMKASGKQLAEITSLIEQGHIKPVVDKIFTFDETNEALEYIEAGRSKGKVVIKIK
ncbi:NADP-dependent oxidoreductase [Pedobacter namyangjuensis]|uniref:NADP-dependent oxidoreductase n=1 Tax=Pedobacter namyangjuensis TaxID=600626 RepID=UPI000DE21CF7|nr:NADP-dependent oxidoreductase [Pedobacter namyangjuensis]